MENSGVECSARTVIVQALC